MIITYQIQFQEDFLLNQFFCKYFRKLASLLKFLQTNLVDSLRFSILFLFSGLLIQLAKPGNFSLIFQVMTLFYVYINLVKEINQNALKLLLTFLIDPQSLIQIIEQILMHFLQERRHSRSRRLVWEGSSDSNSDVDVYKEVDNHTTAESFSALFEAKDKLIKFIDDLGEERQAELRQDVMNHCENNVKNQRTYQSYISSDMIIRIVNIRIEKMIKNKRIKKNWSEEDVKILIWIISKYADINEYLDVQRDINDHDWQFISTLIPGVTPQSCMFKWLSLKKVNLATNNWTQSESNLLGSIVRQQSKESKRGIQIKDWKAVSQKLYKLNIIEDKIFRNAKQCREHWNCYLNPNLKKGPWKPDQDIKLLKKIQQNKGSKKWSQIVKDFDGRTQNALKNRYTLIIDKQKKHNKGKCQLDLIDDYLQRCYVQQFTTLIKSDMQDEDYSSKSPDSFDEVPRRVIQIQINNPEVKQQQIEIQQKNIQNVQHPFSPVVRQVLKFSFQNFSSLTKNNFFKSIQPGIIEADGTFKKIQNKPMGNLSLRRIQSSYY